MAQSQHQYPPRAFSPPQSVQSTHPGAYLPPIKRQRLSPNPQSPYSSPSLPNTSLPNQVFSSPYYHHPTPQINGLIPNTSFDGSNSPAPAGAMGPPSRPVDKPTDLNELSDVLLGSGVDIREEEAALVNRYHQSNANHITNNAGSSFNSSGSNGAGTGIYSAGNSFNMLSQNPAGDRDNFYGGGSFSQPVVPYQSAEERAEEELRRDMRKKAERQQYHLNEPFLSGATVQRSLDKHSHRMQVNHPKTGLLTSNGQQTRPIEIAVAGPDKNEVITTLRGQDLLYENAPLVEFLTLISLATQDRMRAIVEDSAAIAKGRRTGSHGVVPLELADLAVGNGSVESIAALPTPGNSAISPGTNPLKRSFSAANKLPTPVSEGAKSPMTTIAFPNQVAQALRQSAQVERAAEEKRVAKRDRRKARGTSMNGASRPGSISTNAIAPSGPGLLGEQAPDVEVKKNVSKKEQRKHAEAKATEAQQAAATQKTLSMAMGMGGKKYSWMQKGTPSHDTGFPVPSRLNTQIQSKNASGSGSGSQLATGKRKFGDFREDGEFGAGIQLRDVIHILETDVKEKKTLARAFSKLGSRD